MMRFGDGLETAHRLAARVAQWAWKVESSRSHLLTVRSTLLLKEEYGEVPQLYLEVYHTLR